MTTAIIELSDHALRLTRNDGADFTSPGYAVLADDHVHLGDDGRRRSRLYPLSSYSEFWHALGEQPLRKPTRHYRHHADLAFAHLQRLHEQAGRPEEIIFAVPGDMTRERLALLLGLADAGRMRAIGLVDMAVAAAAHGSAPGLHAFVDLHLHRGVITQLRIDGEVVRETVCSVPGVGLERIRDACAHAVAEAFVGSERFDPFAEAATEQALYDHLEVWLEALLTHESIALELEFRGRIYQTRLEREPITRLLRSLLAPLQTALPANYTPILSHAFAGLPGTLEALGAGAIVTATAIAGSCLAHQNRLRRSGEGLAYLTRLPAAAVPEASGNTDGTPCAVSVPQRATHLLAGAIATPLVGRTSYLHRSGQVTSSRDGDVIAAIDGRDAPQLRPLAENAVLCNGRMLATTMPLTPGDRISLAAGTPEFIAIAVLNEHGA
ncbi:MAG: hypothetical protein IT494_09400 [Gammaproteobacteria bacterium]|nr:hypothetical protein [Gammaproteobacteria bacterium]